MLKLNFIITTLLVSMLLLNTAAGLSEEIEFLLETNVLSDAALPGDILQSFLSLKNSSPDPVSGDFYLVMIKPDDEVLYFPGWTKTLNGIELSIPGNFEVEHLELPRQVCGNDPLSGYGEYILACGLLTQSGWASNFGMTGLQIIEDDYFISGKDKVRIMVGEKPQ